MLPFADTISRTINKKSYKHLLFQLFTVNFIGPVGYVAMNDGTDQRNINKTRNWQIKRFIAPCRGRQSNLLVRCPVGKIPSEVRDTGLVEQRCHQHGALLRPG